MGDKEKENEEKNNLNITKDEESMAAIQAMFFFCDIQTIMKKQLNDREKILEIERAIRETEKLMNFFEKYEED